MGQAKLSAITYGIGMFFVQMTQREVMVNNVDNDRGEVIRVAPAATGPAAMVPANNGVDLVIFLP